MNRGSIAFGIIGLILVWKGITGNVMQTKMGDNLFPRWSYIVAGIVLLTFPALAIYTIFWHS